MIVFANNKELNTVLQGLRPSYPETDFSLAAEESNTFALTINGVMVVVMLTDNFNNDNEEETEENG